MPDVAGGGHIGFLLESTHGTYIAPTQFAPVESESLQEVRSDPKRVPILGQAVTQGKVKGREHVAGDITMELLPEVHVYFMIASRWGNNLAKSGVGPYVYTLNDDAAAHVKTNYRSLTIVADRGGIGFAYLGCQVTSHRIFFEDGIPKVTYSIIGRGQSEDYTPGAVTAPTEVPFGADEVAVTVAAGARTDLDSLEFSFDDNGEPQFNLDGNEAASYVKFGEFVGEASYEIDFEDKSDYAIWVARTTQEVKCTLTKSANQIVVVEIHGGLYNAFEVGLAGLGDQVRAAATVEAAYVSGDTAAAEQVITTDENVTIA